MTNCIIISYKVWLSMDNKTITKYKKAIDDEDFFTIEEIQKNEKRRNS